MVGLRQQREKPLQVTELAAIPSKHNTSPRCLSWKYDRLFLCFVSVKKDRRKASGHCSKVPLALTDSDVTLVLTDIESTSGDSDREPRTPFPRDLCHSTEI